MNWILNRKKKYSIDENFNYRAARDLFKLPWNAGNESNRTEGGLHTRVDVKLENFYLKEMQKEKLIDYLVNDKNFRKEKLLGILEITEKYLNPMVEDQKHEREHAHLKET